jgi:heptosyltransferase-2
MGAIRHVHQMQDYLDLAAVFGADSTSVPPRLDVTDQEMESMLVFLARLGQLDTSDAMLLGLNPSAAYGPAKRWPAERFAEVTRKISQRIPNCCWLIFGSRSDAEFCARVAAQGTGRIINLAGKTTLRQLMALLKTCRVLLTNDSGPMHVAAALGTPVVALFGSTSPELTGPGQPGDPRHRVIRNKVPCSPCFRRTCPVDFRCMTGISVAQVEVAILDLLSMNSGLDEFARIH